MIIADKAIMATGHSSHGEVGLRYQSQRQRHLKCGFEGKRAHGMCSLCHSVKPRSSVRCLEERVVGGGGAAAKADRALYYPLKD